MAGRPAGCAGAAAKALSLPDANASIWLSDGIADGGATALAAYLDDLGSLTLSRRGTGRGAGVACRRRSGGKGSRRCTCARCRRQKPRLYEVRASGADGRLLTRRQATLEPGAKSTDSRAGDAERAQKPDDPHRGRGRPIGGHRAVGRRTLAPPPGRDRRAAESAADSRCSARIFTSNGRWGRSPKSATARSTIC